MLIESAFDPFIKDGNFGNDKRTIRGRKLYETFFEEIDTWL